VVTTPKNKAASAPGPLEVELDGTWQAQPLESSEFAGELRCVVAPPVVVPPPTSPVLTPVEPPAPMVVPMEVPLVVVGPVVAPGPLLDVVVDVLELD
jgi:hypothetical protein